jgi:hypothetical protein
MFIAAFFMPFIWVSPCERKLDLCCEEINHFEEKFNEYFEGMFYDTEKNY